MCHDVSLRRWLESSLSDGQEEAGKNTETNAAFDFEIRKERIADADDKAVELGSF